MDVKSKIISLIYQVRSMISDYSVIITIIIFVLVDISFNLATPKLIVPTVFKVNFSSIIFILSSGYHTNLKKKILFICGKSMFIFGLNSSCFVLFSQQGRTYEAGSFLFSTLNLPGDFNIIYLLLLFMLLFKIHFFLFLSKVIQPFSSPT